LEYGRVRAPYLQQRCEGVVEVKIGALILNAVCPGIGTLTVGKVGQGVAQLVIGILGLLLTFTVIGAIIGIPLMLVAWIWGLVSVLSPDPAPVQVTVVHQQATPSPTSQGAATDAVN